jgi:hypothetical protein
MSNLEFAAWMNAVQAELVALLAAKGVVPRKPAP